VNSSSALSLDLAPAASTHDEATVFTNADTAGGKPMTADDQTEIDFWTGMLEEHSNRAMLNISRESLTRLLGIIGKLRTEQRTIEVVDEMPLPFATGPDPDAENDPSLSDEAFAALRAEMDEAEATAAACEPAGKIIDLMEALKISLEGRKANA
jgi:hypothetical protein